MATDYTMEALIAALAELYAATDNATSCEDGYTYFNQSNETDEIESLCNTLLIKNEGRCNWPNIKILKAAGYDVWAGDSDSYGWLTGCIRKYGDSRILMYG